MLLVLGRALSAIQEAIGIESKGEPLNGNQRAMLERIFGQSVDWSRVRIKYGFAGAASFSDRPFAHGDVIYAKKQWISDAALAHEVMHVWQFQNGGPGYMTESIAAQIAEGAEAYRYADDVAAAVPWGELEPEQQGQFIQDAVASGYFEQSGRGGRFIRDGVDYTEYLERALGQIRAGRGA